MPDGTKTYVIVLAQGDEVYSALTSFAIANRVVNATFSAIGGVDDPEVGVYDPASKTYKAMKWNEHMEMLSLSGGVALSAEGMPHLHAHMVMSRLNGGQVVGGHLISAIVAPTLEMHMTTFRTPLHKSLNQAAGMQLIDLTLGALAVYSYDRRVASVSVKIDLGKAPQVIADYFDDLASWSREHSGGYNEEEATKDTKRILTDLEKAVKELAEHLHAAAHRVPNWFGSTILVRPLIDKDNPVYDQGGEVHDFLNGDVYVDKGSVSNHSPGFSLFLHGSTAHVDDVLDAGDTDFFHHPEVASDYFGLVNESTLAREHDSCWGQDDHPLHGASGKGSSPLRARPVDPT